MKENLTGRKSWAYLTISYKICPKIAPIKTTWTWSVRLWSVIRVKIKIQIILCLAFYSAKLLNYRYVLLFSITLRSFDQQLKFYSADKYVWRFLDLWLLLLSFISNFVRLFGIMFTMWFLWIMFGKWAGA